MLKDENVDFICRDEDDNAYLEERKMDLELNCADGQGLIDPEFAKLWGKDMDLNYTPCSFVARSCFIKGNLVTFDFREYAKDSPDSYRLAPCCEGISHPQRPALLRQPPSPEADRLPPRNRHTRQNPRHPYCIEYEADGPCPRLNTSAYPRRPPWKIS